MKQAETCRMFELDWMYTADATNSEHPTDYVLITAKGDLEHLRKLVPAPLEATEDVFIYMGWFNHTFELDGVPQNGLAFHEWGLAIKSRLNREPYTEGNYLVQLYVGDEADLVMAHGREVWGYPKKFAETVMTPSTDGDSSRYDYSITRVGAELVRASVSDLEPVSLEESPLNGPTNVICLKQIPAADSLEMQIQELVFVQVDYTPSEAKSGAAAITFEDGPFDQLPIGPLTDVKGHFVRADFKHHGLATLVVEAEELARPLDYSRAGITKEGERWIA
jgi:acetoacetate decarboxylase